MSTPKGRPERCSSGATEAAGAVPNGERSRLSYWRRCVPGAILDHPDSIIAGVTHEHRAILANAQTARRIKASRFSSAIAKAFPAGPSQPVESEYILWDGMEALQVRDGSREDAVLCSETHNATESSRSERRFTLLCPVSHTSTASSDPGTCASPRGASQ